MNTAMRSVVATSLGLAAVLCSANVPAAVAQGMLRPAARQAAAAEFDLPFTRCTVQELAAQPRLDGSFIVSVALPNGPATLELFPHSIRAAGYQAMERNADGLVEVDIPPETTYRGRVLEHDGAMVVASVIDGQVIANIYMPGDMDPWAIQPLSQFDGHEGAQPVQHVVARASDAIRPAVICGTDERMCAPGCGDHEQPALRGPATACQRIAEIIFETDFEFYQVYGSVPSTVAGAEAYINQVDFIYERDLGTSITTVQLIVTSAAPDAGHPYLTGVDAYQILYGFRDYWATQAAPQRDNVHLLIARDTGGIAGLAYVSATCAGDGYNSGLSRRYTSDFNSMVVVIAHELGHNMGTGHDNQGGACNDSPPGHIMSPSVNTSLMTFSPCTTVNINNYLWGGGGDCLQRLMPGVPFGRPDAGNGIAGSTVFVDVLPNDLSCETMSLQLVSGTSAGGASLSISVGTGWSGTNRIAYTANVSTPAIDTFTYRAVNANGPSLPVTVTMTNQTARVPENPVNTQSALDVSYYALSSSVSSLPNFDLLTPYATSVASTVNFPSTNGVFSDSGRADDVGAVYVGYVEVLTPGLYTLYTESDDGSRLKIGATTVVNNDGLHGMVEQSGQIALGAGKHALRVEFFERGGGAGLIMRWAGPGITKQVIPASRLYRDRLCPTDLDNNGATDVPDLFAFLSLWFAGNAAADWDGVGGIAVPDIFAFLSAWFAAAGPC